MSALLKAKNTGRNYHSPYNSACIVPANHTGDHVAKVTEKENVDLKFLFVVFTEDHGDDAELPPGKKR